MRSKTRRVLTLILILVMSMSLNLASVSAANNKTHGRISDVSLNDMTYVCSGVTDDGVSYSVYKEIESPNSIRPYFAASIYYDAYWVRFNTIIDPPSSIYVVDVREGWYEYPHGTLYYTGECTKVYGSINDDPSFQPHTWARYSGTLQGCM